MSISKAKPEDAADIVDLVRLAYAPTVGSSGISYKTQPRYSGSFVM